MLCLRTAGAYAGRSVETEAAALKALLREQAAATQCEVDVWARRGGVRRRELLDAPEPELLQVANDGTKEVNDVENTVKNATMESEKGANEGAAVAKTSTNTTHASTDIKASIDTTKSSMNASSNTTNTTKPLRVRIPIPKKKESEDEDFVEEESESVSKEIPEEESPIVRIRTSSLKRSYPVSSEEEDSPSDSDTNSKRRR